MAYRVNYVNKYGKKKNFTYLTPEEKVDKYESELWAGFKIDYNHKPKITKASPLPNLYFLNRNQIKFREDYISSYKQKKPINNNYGSLAFHRDYQYYLSNKDRIDSRNK